MDSGPGVLRQLDREWERIGGSASGRVALRRWAESEPALVGMRSLAEVVQILADLPAGVIAGGTDLLPNLKHRLGAPTVLVGKMPQARISDNCVCVGPPLFVSGAKSGSVFVWSAVPVRNPPPLSALML